MLYWLCHAEEEESKIEIGQVRFSGFLSLSPPLVFPPSLCTTVVGAARPEQDDETEGRGRRKTLMGQCLGRFSLKLDYRVNGEGATMLSLSYPLTNGRGLTRAATTMAR